VRTCKLFSDVSMDIQTTWQCLGTVQRQPGLVMATGDDVPVGDEKNAPAEFTEKPRCVGKRCACVLR